MSRYSRRQRGFPSRRTLRLPSATLERHTDALAPTRAAAAPAIAIASPGDLPSPAGLTCPCTCHCTPVWAPGTAELPGEAGVIGLRAGAIFLAKVSIGNTATLAGGWAGAGPSSGLSG